MLSKILTRVALPATAAVCLFTTSAAASHHLMQIEQLIGGVESDFTKQAVQLRMRSALQDQLQNGRLMAYDGSGANPVELIDFASSVPNDGLGVRVLIATPGFVDSLDNAITPDFVMNVIPNTHLAAGSVTFENNAGTSIWWRICWGNYTGPTTGSLSNDDDGDFGPPIGGFIPAFDLDAFLFQGAAGDESTMNMADYAVTPGASTWTNNAGDSGTLVSPNPRDVQFVKVDFETGVITLRNLGGIDAPLDGWRMCTADEDETFRYTSTTGLNGFTIPAGGDFFVHTNNDAPGGSDSVNVSALGGTFATPFDSGAYGMGIYFQTPFGTGTNLADYLQWSIDGIDNTSADARSATAVNGGVWTGQEDWISTAADSTSICLIDLSGAELQGPANYEVLGPVEPCIGDCAPEGGNGAVNVDDLLAVLNAISTQDLACDVAPAPAGNGVVNFDDLIEVVNNFGPCD